MLHRVILSLALLFISVATIAQPGGGGDPGSGAPVPLGGLEYLIAAGAALGIKKIWSARKRS
ncbi:hypothetical protein JMN32_00495 [Fulvivirga sp. 29W222]|uniref:Uncharacterized protein n=1 Tax=Fulvivirga marina TaxID=2494733 RepID=A0A937KAN2_9BACT|nr:hypothetical protein [Fulvivirga marina]MBL6444767.1 hypothetical protein [Fulvivirga marina]